MNCVSSWVRQTAGCLKVLPFKERTAGRSTSDRLRDVVTVFRMNCVSSWVRQTAGCLKVLPFKRTDCGTFYVSQTAGCRDLVQDELVFQTWVRQTAGCLKVLPFKERTAGRSTSDRLRDVVTVLKMNYVSSWVRQPEDTASVNIFFWDILRSMSRSSWELWHVLFYILLRHAAHF